MEKIRQKIYSSLRMQSIYHRVNTISVTIGTMAMVLLTAICIFTYIQSTMELLQERESRYLSIYSANLSNELFTVGKDVSSLSEEEQMQRMLAEDYPLTPEAHQFKKLVLTQTVERQLAYNDAVTDVYLFTTRDDPINLFRGPHGDLDVEALNTISLFYETGFFSADGACFLDAAEFSLEEEKNNQGILCMYRVLESGTAKTRGYLLAYLNKQVLFGGLNPAEEEGKGIRRFMLDQKGQLVYGADADLAPETLSRICERMTEDEGVFRYGPMAGITGGMCIYSRLSGLNIYTVAMIPYSAVSGEVFMILAAVLILLALLFILYSVASSCIAQSISRPVEQMLQSLREIQQENFRVGPYDDHPDELAEVNNFMNDTKLLLSELITKIRENEQQKYRLQLQVLRTQINPHFLVNTLNSIIWLADLQGAENIRALTSSLIEVLVPCMRNASGVATIRSELQLLRDYSTIMDFQYMDQFQLEFDVDEEIQDYLAPILFLQPLVENALIHGRDTNSPILNIRIRGRMEEGRIHIQVCDDGKGISAQRLKEISQRSARKEKVQTLTRIGVTNIRERLELYFGEGNCTLTITSQENMGTTVDILLPPKSEQEEKAQ